MDPKFTGVKLRLYRLLIEKGEKALLSDEELTLKDLLGQDKGVRNAIDDADVILTVQEKQTVVK